MNSPNTIAIVVPSDLFKTNGSSIRARRIIPLISAKYPSLVLTRCDLVDSDLLGRMNVKREDLIIEGKSSKNLYLDILLQWLWNFRLVKNLIRSRVRVIYGQGIYQLPAYCLVSRICNRKFVYEAHSLVYKEQRQTSKILALFFYSIEFIVGKVAHRIIALSGEAYSFYRKLSERVFYIPVFVDTELYGSGQKLLPKTVNKRVGLIGPFDTRKNRYQFEFLNSNLEKFDRRITFSLIGKSERSPLDRRIVNIGFLKTEKDYVEAISKLDAAIVPVKIGTFGPKNKILEAMACSLPVFTTPNGVLGLDFAHPNDNILVFKENQLVNKINELLFDESFLRVIRKKARETVDRFYSKNVCEERILNVLADILK